MGLSICLKYVVDAEILREEANQEKPDWEEYNPGEGATPEEVKTALEKFHQAVIEFSAKSEMDETKVDESDNYVICEWYDDGYVCKNFTEVNKILKKFVDDHYNVSFRDIRVIACLSE